MKKRNVLYILLTLSIIALIILPILFYVNLNLSLHKNTNSLKNYTYHFVMIGQNSDENFWKLIKRGADDVAKKNNIAFEFKAPIFTNSDEETRYFDMAVAAKVDGIITHVPNDPQYKKHINKAVEAGIPVITIVSDSPDSKRECFVGYSEYEQGLMAGKLIIEATGNSGKVAIFHNRLGKDSADRAESERNSGLQAALKDYPGIKIAVEKYVRGKFEAELLTQQLIKENSKVNIIYCSNAKDTLGAAQIIAEEGKIGSLEVIGFEDLPEIQNNINKKMVYGTVVVDAETIGKESVEKMFQFKRNKKVSNLNTGVTTISRKDIKAKFPKPSKEEEAK